MVNIVVLNRSSILLRTYFCILKCRVSYFSFEVDVECEVDEDSDMDVYKF